MSKNWNKQEQDDEEKRKESAGTFALNQGILQEWEEYNFGGKQMFPRNGDNSVYTNTGTDLCAIPIGLPIAFSDPLFVKKFQSCPHLRASFKGFSFDCKQRQNISPPLASDDKIKECMGQIKETLAVAKSKAFAAKKPKLYQY
jgi:hypothetical protein